MRSLIDYKNNDILSMAGYLEETIAFLSEGYEHKDNHVSFGDIIVNGIPSSEKVDLSHQLDHLLNRIENCVFSWDYVNKNPAGLVSSERHDIFVPTYTDHTYEMCSARLRLIGTYFLCSAWTSVTRQRSDLIIGLKMLQQFIICVQESPYHFNRNDVLFMNSCLLRISKSVPKQEFSKGIISVCKKYIKSIKNEHILICISALYHTTPSEYIGYDFPEIDIFG